MAPPERVDLSVVISTYNRSDELKGALEAVARQQFRTPRQYEVIVVDNNSNDRTREVAQSFVARYPHVRYVFEPRQGLSYGRNAGIAASAGASILAFTDDDVRAAPDWVDTIVTTFERRPDIDYVGGKVLPGRPLPPLGWLTPNNWSPLALCDFGEASFISDRDAPMCFVGANLAIRRHVFDVVGLFDPAVQRVRDGIGSSEDHEVQLRIWRAGFRGLYAPEVVVLASVASERLTKRYHAMWHKGHGRYLARMRFYETSVHPWGPLGEPPNLIKLFGSPAFVYTDLLRFARMLVVHRFRGRSNQAFSSLCRCYQLANYLRTSWAMHREGSHESAVTEAVRFLRAYTRKHVWRTQTDRPVPSHPGRQPHQ